MIQEACANAHSCACTVQRGTAEPDEISSKVRFQGASTAEQMRQLQGGSCHTSPPFIAFSSSSAWPLSWPSCLDSTRQRAVCTAGPRSCAENREGRQLSHTTVLDRWAVFTRVRQQCPLTGKSHWSFTADELPRKAFGRKK